MNICYTDYIFLGVWALIGGILGFFAFGNKPCTSLSYKIGRCFLSVGIGMFIAFPLYAYLRELDKLPKDLNIMLAGLGSFGLPDAITKYWPIVTKTFVSKLTKVVYNSDVSITRGIDRNKHE